MDVGVAKIVVIAKSRQRNILHFMSNSLRDVTACITRAKLNVNETN